MSARTTTDRQQFTGSMRFLHWLMAAMVLTMLGIGIAMVASLGDYHLLVSIHRPLGIAILIVVVIRFVNRQFSTLPPFPASMSSQERFVAHASEVLLYTLLFVQPLVGWGMLSAARYPIILFGLAHETYCATRTGPLLAYLTFAYDLYIVADLVHVCAGAFLSNAGLPARQFVVHAPSRVTLLKAN